MQDVKYDEIHRQLRDSCQKHSIIVGRRGGSLFCESPDLWNSRELLAAVFGFDSFRPMQKEVISCVLSGRDTLAVMPTGGGKSLCYQLSALLMGGLTIVVSPLIALMTDQVAKLRPRLEPLGMEVLALHGDLPPEGYAESCRKLEVCCDKGKCGILYVSPEALSGMRLRRLLDKLKNQVRLLAVDEAHCVSEWGHDFRPDYLGIGEIRRTFPQANCLALTATATGVARQDIIRQLGLDRPEILIGSFDRPKIYIEVRLRQRGSAQIEAFLARHRGESGIIYCFSRKEADGMAARLSGRGFSITSYHAGLSDSERTERQLRWLSGEVRIMAATVAFGMGIDKCDVRFVIHASMPRSIEEYYQEIGRAGRDGKRADALMLYSPGDASKIRYFFRGKENPVQAQMQLQEMMRFVAGKTCRRRSILSYFGQDTPPWRAGGIIPPIRCCDVCARMIGAAEEEFLRRKKA